MLCPDHEVPPKSGRRPSPVCKKQRVFIFIQVCKLRLSGVQRIGVIGEPCAQLGLGFHSNKGGGEGYLRCRTPDCLMFVRSVLVKSAGCVLTDDPIYDDWNFRNFLRMF